MKNSVEPFSPTNAVYGASFLTVQLKSTITVSVFVLCGLFSLSVFAQESSGVSGEAGTGGLSLDSPEQRRAATSQSTASAGAATEAPVNVLSATVGHTVTRYSNLFRRPDSANPRTDTLNATALSVRFDKPVSQQHFHLEVSEIINRYSNSSYLDFSATNYAGSWRWAPSQRWAVEISADRAKTLAPFEDTLGGSQRNITTTENRGATVDGWLAGPWYLALGIGQSDRKSEQGVIGAPDERIETADIGLRYLTARGNSITLSRAESKGEYLNNSVAPGGSGNDFRESETGLSAIWRLTEKSAFEGKIARQERDNDQVGQRDFSGPYVQLGYTWTPTQALSFNLSASRDNLPLLDPSYSYSREDSLSFSPTWRVSDKVSTYLRLSRAERSYRGEGVLPPVGPAREDRTNDVEVGLAWAPVRTVTVSTSFQQQRRSSNQAVVEYDDEIATVGVSWLFW